MTDKARVQDGESESGDWICRWCCTCGDHGPWVNTKNRHRVQADKDAHQARHAEILAAREQQILLDEAAEEEQANANGDPCANPDCDDCTTWDGGAENASEDHLIEWARGEYR